MADPISKERLDRMGLHWNSVLQQYPTLRKYGDMPFDETGFDPGAYNEYQKLKSQPPPAPPAPLPVTPAPTPQQQTPVIPEQPAPSVTAPTQTRFAPTMPGERAEPLDITPHDWGTGGYLVDKLSRAGVAAGTIAGLYKTGDFKSFLPGAESAKKRYPTMAGTEEERRTFREAIAKESSGGFGGWLTQVGANLMPVGGLIESTLDPVWDPVAGVLAVGLEQYLPDPEVLKEMGMSEPAIGWGAYEKLQSVMPSGEKWFTDETVQKFYKEEMAKLIRESPNKRPSGIEMVQASARAMERAKATGEIPIGKELMYYAPMELPSLVGAGGKIVGKVGARIAARQAAEAQAKAATARGRTIPEIDEIVARVAGNSPLKTASAKANAERLVREKILQLSGDKGTRIYGPKPFKAERNYIKRNTGISDEELDGVLDMQRKMREVTTGLGDELQVAPLGMHTDDLLLKISDESTRKGVSDAIETLIERAIKGPSMKLKPGVSEASLKRDILRHTGVDSDVLDASLDAQVKRRQAPSGSKIIGDPKLEPEGRTGEFFGPFRLEGFGPGKRLLRRTPEGVRQVITKLRDRTRLGQIIDSQSAVYSKNLSTLVRENFNLADDGTIPDLAGVVKDDFNPTIQDVAAKLPKYWESLTPAQQAAMRQLRKFADDVEDLRNEHGIGKNWTGSRPDVEAGGFFLTRGGAKRIDDLDVGAEEGWWQKTLDQLFDESPTKHKSGQLGIAKAAKFASQGEGVSAGWEYVPFEEAMHDYVRAVGYKARDVSSANYLKGLVDEEGIPLGRTVKQLMMSQGEEGASVTAKMDAIRKEIQELKAAFRRYGVRQDAAFDEMDSYIDESVPDEFVFKADVSQQGGHIIQLTKTLSDLRGQVDKLEVRGVRGKFKGARSRDLKARIDQLLEESRELQPEYSKVMSSARDAPGRSNIESLKELSGVKFPDEWAKAAKMVLESERTPDSHYILRAINQFQRAIGASLDISALGIQGLLFAYRNPGQFPAIVGLTVKSFKSRDVMDAFRSNFDQLAKRNGRLTVNQWAADGLHQAGDKGEFLVGKGILESKFGRPFRASNRSFSASGDSMRLRFADEELARQIKGGRTLGEIRQSGDLERIANAANSMTGFTEGRSFENWGDLLLFAPRFLQARLNTVARAGRGTYYGIGGRAGVTRGASIEERMSRNAVMRMISFGSAFTFGMNHAFGEETDTRLFVDGKVNRDFMVIKSPFGRVSMFGPYDSLLRAMGQIVTGNPDRAFHNLSSASVRTLWDIALTGEDWQGKPVNPFGVTAQGATGKEGWGTTWNFIQWIGDNYSPFAAGELGEEILTKTAPSTVEKIKAGEPVAAAGEVLKFGAGAFLELPGVKRSPKGVREEAEDVKINALRDSRNLHNMGDVLDHYKYTDEEAFKNIDRNARISWDLLPNIARQDAEELARESRSSAALLDRLEGQESYGPMAEYYQGMEEAETELSNALLSLEKASVADDPDVSPMKKYRRDSGRIRGDYYKEAELRREGVDFGDKTREGLREAENVINSVLYGDDAELTMEITGGYESIEDAVEGFNFDEYERRKTALDAKYGEKFVKDLQLASMRRRYPEGHPEYERKEVLTLLEDTGYFRANEDAASKLGLTEQWNQYQNATTAERRELKKSSAIKRVLKAGESSRNAKRLRNKELDTALIRWGYVSIPILKKMMRGFSFTRGGIPMPDIG